jgi:hypothetical protein
VTNFTRRSLRRRSGRPGYGDIEKIIAAKRADTALLFFTDGVTWKRRQSDLKKIVAYQNNRDIARIYTYAMTDKFEADLKQLKKESGLQEDSGA